MCTRYANFHTAKHGTPHVITNDPDVLWAELPDLNVLDLGYLSSLQSLQYHEDCFNIDEVIAAVKGSYRRLESDKLNNIFLMLQKLWTDGSNEYKLPHVGKVKLQRRRELPQSLHCDPAVEHAVRLLHEGVVIDV
ncbi:Transposon protein [Phytophthora megakarya]|uniref:Transposon protein n=1 Tax=Phytophthora megakarya TaxID=4795 RepID=A0A225VBD2_9STRA|nr:Transposon protein [Phytophthora megakarya]